MKIAIASGKGGTGKSTVAVNFAYCLSKYTKNVTLLDCDVEEPNCHIFLKPVITKSEDVFVTVPRINKDKCISCGRCAEVCEFNALAFGRGNVLVFDELCHGCGSCVVNCKANAITEDKRKVGTINFGNTKNINFIEGQTRIGEAMSPPLIKAVKKNEEKDSIQILDCPPGTSCPVISAVSGVDFVMLVTEPTPFGLNDLILAVEVIKKLNIPFGIIINRFEEEDNIISNWAKNNQIKILAKIKNDRKIAECYSKGEIIIDKIPEIEESFKPLLKIAGVIL